MNEHDRKVNLIFSLIFWVPFVLWMIGFHSILGYKMFNLVTIGFLLLPFAGLFTKGEDD